ncbi:hypothetical protein [Paenibacillus turpanensis]|uniref:hypothetical protein n=1 Tax=Paenibacillus turpanensis TaxID=2689078 RepID=UPI0014075879|nr:hypothetical protein [Paenibacillus turpanensis]
MDPIQSTNTESSLPSRSARMRKEQQGASSTLPSRRAVYPSNKMKLEKWFFNSLIALFLVLTAGLIFWGTKHME